MRYRGLITLNHSLRCISFGAMFTGLSCGAGLDSLPRLHGAQVFVPTVKPQADDGDFYRSFAPYRVLELFVCLFAGW